MTSREFPFYVVAIPDKYTILVSGGQSYIDELEESLMHLVETPPKVGDKIEIVLPGKEIIDPISNESLGYYDSVKDTIEITKIHPNFFECSKLIKAKSGFSDYLSPMFAPEGFEYIELSVNKNEVLDSDLTENDLIIKIGDPVKFLN